MQPLSRRTFLYLGTAAAVTGVSGCSRGGYTIEPDPRFPMATTYTATVAAGTESAVGGSLDEAHSWTFTTPPPVATTTPGNCVSSSIT